MKRKFWMRKLAMFILLWPLALLLFGFIVMSLWNFTLTPVLHVSAITFWQALGFLLLSKILFGGFHGGWRQRRGFWKQNMEEKFSGMTPEEREKFKQEFRNRCGRWGRPVNQATNSGAPSEPLSD